MFCSNCGKTLKADVAKCPHCGAKIGESRFDGQQPYTGAQMRIKPGEAVRLPANHTRTTYMGSAPDMEGDVETRTTYRATNEGAAPLYKEPEPLFNAEEEEPLSEEIDVPAEEEADYLTPEMADQSAEATEDPAAAEMALLDEDDEDDDDYDFEREEREEEERLRAERKAEKKARREARRAERRQREAELEALDDEKLGEPIDDDEDEEERPRRQRRRRDEDEEEKAEIAEELAELRVREIEEVKLAGASEDLLRYMQERRSQYEGKKPANDKPAAKKVRGWFTRKKRQPVEEENFDLDEDITAAEEGEADEPRTPAEAFAREDREQYGEAEETPPEAEEYEPDEEAQYVSEDDELTFTSENPHVDDDFSDVDLTFDEEEDFVDEETLARRRKVFGLLKYVVLAGILVAIIVGVTTLLSNIAQDGQKSQIPNVSSELFEQGVELMQYRVGNDYIKSRLGLYDPANSSTVVAVSDALSKDLDALSSLLPENPDLNDQRFISALSAIQSDINNCLTNDILSLSDATKTNDVKTSESDARWAIVRDKVSALAAATDKSQLDAIIKGDRIEVIQQATAEPAATSTPEPYAKLSKGSKGEAVMKLQTRLTALGYMDSEIDGDYGTKTKTAVQLFQKDAGLEVTGIADAQTQERLYAPDAPMKSN